MLTDKPPTDDKHRVIRITPKRPMLPFIITGIGIVLAIAAAGLHLNGYPDEAPWLAAIAFMLVVTGAYSIWKARDE